MKLYLVILFTFIASSVFSQTYQKIVYSVDQGLITHLTKTVETDSIGFLWIGTDEGLVRYNGSEFIAYPTATPNRYVKEITQLKNGRLVVITDLGITEILQVGDSVRFANLILGKRNRSDSLLSYPKQLYEDQKSRYWVSEPNSVVHLSEDFTIIKRYDFPDKEISLSFMTSYNFFEHGGQLYTISYNGNIFQFVEEKDQFELVFDHGDEVWSVQSAYQYGNKVVLATSNGLYEVIFDEGEVSIEERLRTATSLITLHRIDVDYLFAGGGATESYLIDINTFTIVEQFPVFKAKDVKVMEGGDIWVGSDEGLVLFKKDIFRSVDEKDNYIESVLALDSVIYYCHKDELIKLDLRSKPVSKNIILNEGDNYFLCLSGGENKFWIADRNKVLLIENDQVTERIDLAYRGFFVFAMHLDNTNNLWLSQDNTAGVLRIAPNREKINYAEDQGVPSRIIVISESNTGDIYLGGIGGASYLFKYNPTTDSFDNLSVPVETESEIDIEINDLVARNDTVWLASSLGVLEYINGKVKHLNIEDGMRYLPVRTIDLQGDNLWFSNTYGLINLNLRTNEMIKYTESSGLRSRSANPRAMEIDKYGVKWVGTAKGLSYSIQRSTDYLKTKEPILEKVFINGNELNKSRFNQSKIPNEAFIRFEFFSLSLPGDLLEYQYRIDGQSKWVGLGSRNSVELTSQASGKHQVQIRARRQGNYKWSDPLIVKYNVDLPRWLQADFIIFLIVGLSALVYLVYRINVIRLKSTERKLNKIVNERTLQLQKANEELQQINKELDMFVYSASHDMKAPLSSINGLLSLYKLEKDDEARERLMHMMSNSIERLEIFLKEVIDYSKNSRMEVIYEAIDFRGLVSEILDSYRYLENYDKIDISLNIENGRPYRADKSRVRIILNNLISNAIRYCDLDKKRPFIKINIAQQGKYIVIKVSDNGLGIDNEHLPRIYDMFYRANETKSGSGLGLYIIRESVKNLNGTVEVQSEEGKGTEFSITIPMPDQVKVKEY